jgi:hypothetical protein
MRGESIVGGAPEVVIGLNVLLDGLTAIAMSANKLEKYGTNGNRALATRLEINIDVPATISFLELQKKKMRQHTGATWLYEDALHCVGG